MSENLSLLTDLYELTMMQGYFKNNNNRRVIFDIYYRQNPFGGGYAITCGLEKAINYIKNLRFDDEDIDYLRSTGKFDEDFLKYLKDFKFTGDVYAIPEGTVIFPREPIMKIIAPIGEAQIMESALLNIINHQSLIATKASRVVNTAGSNSTVMEFGLRRAQGPDAAVYGARAAVIAGCAGTSNVLAGRLFDIPVMGTHAHSWIMSFPCEYDAFKSYAELYPDNCILLVDTYNTLLSGIPNAIKVFEEMRSSGTKFKTYGIRLDSGDLAYLTKRARKMLDEAGMTDAVITVSGDLDEYLMESLISQGACINSWGVGTNLITARDNPAFGGVYKLSAIENESGDFIPAIKISENTSKISDPGDKLLYRIYDNSNKILADFITLSNEKYDQNKPLELFDPNEPWKTTVLNPGDYSMRPLLEQIFKDGKCIYTSPNVFEISKYRAKELDTLWDEVKRLLNPHEVYVDLSRPLYDLKQELLRKHSKKEFLNI